MAVQAIDGVLAELVGGAAPGRAALLALSDLDRPGLAAVRSRWLAIPPATREALVSEAALLSESDVGFDFERLWLVALDDPQPAVRRQSASALFEAGSREAGGRLAAALRSDGDAAVRVAAADSLAAFVAAWGGRRDLAEPYDLVLSALREAALGDEVPEVRGRALVSAAGTNAPWIEALIEDAYYEEDRSLRLAAVEAMGQTCDESWLEYLVEQLESDDPDFRYEAVLACGEIGSEESLEALAALSGDPVPEVADAAVRAIGRIGGPVAAALLSDLRSDPPPGLDLGIVDDALLTARGALSDEVPR